MVQIIPNSEVLETFQQGEKLIFATRPSRLGQIGVYAMAACIPLCALTMGIGVALWSLIVSIVILAPPEIEIRRQRYYFTNYKIVVERGIISKAWNHIGYNRITDVSVTKNWMERFLDIGDVRINTAGSAGYEAALKDVSDPEAVQRFLLSMVQHK